MKLMLRNSQKAEKQREAHSDIPTPSSRKQMESGDSVSVRSKPANPSPLSQFPHFFHYPVFQLEIVMS